VATARGQEENAEVQEATNTALHTGLLGRALPRGPSLGLRRTLRPGVVNLAGQPAEVAARNTKKDEPNAQVGQAFLDLLLVGATAAHCPLALLTVARGDSWTTLSYGADREAVEDPDLFAIIAGRREPVEVTDPATNPALSRTRLARSDLGVRWLLAVPLLGPGGEVMAIFAVLDTQPRDLTRRERAAMVAAGRLITTTLSAHRSGDNVLGGAQLGASEPKPAQDGSSLLRSHEVAALFDVTERTVINWASSGKLACLRTVGGHLRFRSEDVMALLEVNSLRHPHTRA
jgi:excisionase family DNA binding protein